MLGIKVPKQENWLHADNWSTVNIIDWLVITKKNTKSVVDGSCEGEKYVFTNSLTFHKIIHLQICN